MLICARIGVSVSAPLPLPQVDELMGSGVLDVKGGVAARLLRGERVTVPLPLAGADQQQRGQHAAHLQASTRRGWARAAAEAARVRAPGLGGGGGGGRGLAQPQTSVLPGHPSAPFSNAQAQRCVQTLQLQ